MRVVWPDGSQSVQVAIPADLRLLLSHPSTATAVHEGSGSSTYQLRLAPSHPNPYNSETVLRFQVPAGEAQLVIYNLAGQEIATLVDEEMAAGAHAVRWGGRNQRGRRVASGVYFAQLRSGSDVRVRQMLLLK